MGALLSLPLMVVPSMATVGTFLASCCGAATCSAVCSACGKFRNSMATRIAYAFILLINSIISWLMLTSFFIEKLERLSLDYMKIKCRGQDCYGYVAVQRIGFALGLFHFLLAILLMGVKTSKDPRANLQNGFWGPKIIVWLIFIVITFFIPEAFFTSWGPYFAFPLGMLFILLGLILLVDLAHTFAEYCLEKIDTYDSRGWRIVLVGSTLGMFAISMAMTIVMYIFFARNKCHMNQAAITINLLLMLGTAAASVAPAIQEVNPRAGLAQSAMVAVYCTYLTLSAVSMEPDDGDCNPLIRGRGTRTATIVLGAIVTMLTIAYTTTRAATQGFALGNNTNGAAYAPLGEERVETGDHDLVTQQPSSSRREMRAEALRRAVAEGSLPASALDESDSDSDSDDEGGSRRKKKSKDDERAGTQYNYALFHVIFLLATCWVASLLTSSVSASPKDAQGNVLGDGETHKDLVAVGRTYWASWVKIISAWICYAIYLWSLVAPIVLPGRFDS